MKREITARALLAIIRKSSFGNATPTDVLTMSMVELAEMLAAPLKFARIDFYEIDGCIYFGELTFCHFAGIVPFEPEEWDYKLGELIKLPKK